MTTGGDSYDLRLHNVEIKTSESDLKGDDKATEYADFVDYSWFAVPPHLVGIAREIKPSTFGIIAISKSGNNHVYEVVESSAYVPGMARMDTLQTALIKLL